MSNHALGPLLVPTLLFVALTPGILLKIPGDKQPIDVGTTGRTDFPSTVVHAGVFAAANYAIAAMRKTGKQVLPHLVTPCSTLYVAYVGMSAYLVKKLLS
eukprot:jgi/Mesen1/992/ME000120S00149